MINILLVSIVTLSISFIITYLRSLHKLSTAKKEIAKLLVNIVVLEEYVKGIEDHKIEKDESVHKENFIKFLSDSRDWAFEYIEDVQKALSSFIEEVQPKIDYFDSYGVAGPIGPNYDALKQISASFKELKKVLPEDTDAKL